MIPIALIRERLDSVTAILSALSERQFVSLKLAVVVLSLASGSLALSGSANELYRSLFEARYRLALLLSEEDALRGELQKMEREVIQLNGSRAISPNSGLAGDADVVAVIDAAAKVSGARIGGLNILGGGVSSKKKRHQLAISGGYKELVKFAQLLSERGGRRGVSLSEVGIKRISFRYPKEPLEGRVLIDEETGRAP